MAYLDAMTGETVLKEISLTLPMGPEMEIAASRAATAVAESMKMSADKIDEVRMAVVEACINAIEHSGSADQNVYLTFSVYGEAEPVWLQVVVRDQGVGFAPDELEEPRIEDKLKADRKRGWGLKIMRGLMDEVDIRSGNNGTTIVMSKAR
ncbi:MAG: ATP-binding protein [Acidobacteriota bacterium]|jgi:serine/threonine-protein kinase RsbW